MRLWRTVAALSLAAGLAVPAVAQDFPGPPPGGPPMGMRGGMPATGAALLTMPAVQQELKLTDEQKEKAAALVEEFRATMRASRGRMNPADFENMPPDEAEHRMAEMRKQTEETAKEYDGKAAEILNPEQRRRFEQLRLQRQGLGGLLRPDVRERLGLKEDQAERIRDLQGDAGPFMVPPAERQKALADAQALLTREQRKLWTELTGPEFAFPAEQPGGPGGRGQGGGGPGGPGQPERKLLKQFDKDGDGRLNAAERTEARASIRSERRAGGPGGRGPGGGRMGPGGGGSEEPAGPGPRVAPAEVKPESGGLYEPTVLRTLFLEFESPDWEAELSDFYHTDVDVPAKLIVDGKEYKDVGVGFRGASSYFTVGAGRKRSLNVSMDLADPGQRLYGYKTLNLLNGHADPSFLHTVLFFHIAGELKVPAPQANFVRVVINGESWGLYVNAQQFDKTLIAERFPDGAGARWKVPGSPRGRGGLEYLGEDAAAYESRYEIKSGDNDKDWKALINLCRVLNETPLEELEAKLSPILDLDGALWFLALDAALTNGDGYWTRASDYSIFLDAAGKFHLLPHDANETLQAGGGGPGGPGGGGAGGRGVELDPLAGLNDKSKPLRSRLLAVPSLRAKYLANVRTIAEQWLDWNRLGPVVERYRKLIEPVLEADTKKLTQMDEWRRAVSSEAAAAGEGRRGRLSLRQYAEQRRKYLLEHPEIKALAKDAGRAQR